VTEPAAELDLDEPVNVVPFCPLCGGAYSIHVDETPAPRLQNGLTSMFVAVATHCWECQVCKHDWTEVEFVYVGPAASSA
jgi:hypothetical protein